MEDILDLYEEDYNVDYPVVCFDETSKQLIGEVRKPLTTMSGKAERYDYEYKRNGTKNLFMICEPKGAWRHVEVSERRTKQDFAKQIKWLTETAKPQAKKIRISRYAKINVKNMQVLAIYSCVKGAIADFENSHFLLHRCLVMDNLNTHKPASFYETFAPQEARSILKRIEFHYTPKYASWLNMAEIELSVLAQQCLNRRIGDEETLKAEIAAWEQKRNATKEAINWQFTTGKAREKLVKHYPSF